MKYPQLYQHFNQWTPIPPEEWLHFESKLVSRRLAKNEFLLLAGETELKFGIILSGLFRLYYTDKNGKEFIKAFRKSGELVGPYAELLMDIPSRTSIQALEKSELVVMAKEDFFPFYSHHSCWQTLGRLVAEKFFLAKEQREYEFLQLNAKERYELFCEEFGDLHEKIPQHQIASYLGITPVALSRTLSRSRTK